MSARVLTVRILFFCNCIAWLRKAKPKSGMVGFQRYNQSLVIGGAGIIFGLVNWDEDGATIAFLFDRVVTKFRRQCSYLLFPGYFLVGFSVDGSLRVKILRITSRTWAHEPLLHPHRGNSCALPTYIAIYNRGQRAMAAEHSAREGSPWKWGKNGKKKTRGCIEKEGKKEGKTGWGREEESERHTNRILF